MLDAVRPDDGERRADVLQEQRLQAKGDRDVAWNLQWARRSHLYSFENLTKWGLGLPLGILAWAGFIYMGWRILKGEWRHALLWGWTAIYFLWQSMQFNPTMRYQLPIYPLLAMMAAWFIFELAGWSRQPSQAGEPLSKKLSFAAVLASVLGFSVLILTAIWAFAFHSIYLRDEPRIAASRWIFQNVPGPINLQIDTNKDGVYAIGDLAGPPWLAHKAMHEGVVCVEKIAGVPGVHALDKGKIPGCTYCDPQVASVGLTEARAKELGRDVRVGRYSFGANGKAIALGEDQGLIKTIFDKKSGELLGAHMVGAEVTELIQGFVVAMNLETTEEELMHTIFPHPTLSEMMKESVLDAYGRVLNA